ncbi:dihydrodipicolinate synthase family protein [Nocardia gipuzkoensis]|uniref:dihydrodipicolinate synthase family protein n=1 Tax=Nocardia gipuzkoensis TaxID=2749991 RepID=UPI00237D8C13|nr:dihydrodipicolinate synthase family protein [Nocardia gipuzkoensis]MDE1674870.1 dihydrodipicolinate synthase family protein [Nocardia gipuzkoensis]
MAMMPAFSRPGSDAPDATDTIAVDELQRAVRQIIDDGVDLIGACGSFGEGWALLDDEYRTLVAATVEAVDGRVPLFVGCIGLSGREIIRKIGWARDAGARGVLVGLPFYYPLDVATAVRFYRDVAEMFADLQIVIYHNPLHFRTRIPVEAFADICTSKNIVGLKDSHRETRAFLELIRVSSPGFSVFVSTRQYYPYVELGAAGFWSYECWMGPEPVLRLRDLISLGDIAGAVEVQCELMGAHETPTPPVWRETAAKLAVGMAGYCKPGSLRHPYREIPAAVKEQAAARAGYWSALVAKYRKNRAHWPVGK